jgi:hypothetical protein
LVDFEADLLRVGFFVAAGWDVGAVVDATAGAAGDVSAGGVSAVSAGGVGAVSAGRAGAVSAGGVGTVSAGFAADAGLASSDPGSNQDVHW